ncbi:MAG: hypothetical protein ACYC27_23015 [Armatimonadota bacterium]
MALDIWSIIGIVIVIILFVYDMKRWNSMQNTIRPKHKWLRLASMLLLIAILIMTLIGDNYLMKSILYQMLFVLFWITMILLAITNIGRRRN